MFSSLKSRLLLGLYVFILLSIPLGSFAISQQRSISSSASEKKSSIITKTATSSGKLKNSAASDLLGLLESDSTISSSDITDSGSPTIATSFGPTMSLKIKIEGRPPDNQAIKLFVGIIEGALTSNPKFLLNFKIDIPADGTFSNLSLAGLTSGNKYTALLKGDAQIASSVEFTMSPNVTNLNDGKYIELTSGDLNEDNGINSADHSIVKALLGVNSKSSKWNQNVDLNKDGVINSVDLMIVSKNLGKVGVSGVWSSPLPKNASPSGSLTNQASVSAYLPVGYSYNGSGSGYWIWMPN